jgi:hypothetical protein
MHNLFPTIIGHCLSFWNETLGILSGKDEHTSLTI